MREAQAFEHGADGHAAALDHFVGRCVAALLFHREELSLDDVVADLARGGHDDFIDLRVDEGLVHDRDGERRVVEVEVGVDYLAELLVHALFGRQVGELVGVDHVEELLRAQFDKRLDDRFLVAEVVVDVAGAHPELLRDVAQGRLVEALLLEAALGGVEYLVAA